jgi:DNA polymerase V
MRRYIMVIDCNNFFVSCERLFRPDLEKKPVLVLSSNDGCVVARSQEVKDIGISMGVPYFQIKDIIKDSGIIVFSGNHTNYQHISRRIMSVIASEFPVHEQYSIDESFVAVDTSDVAEVMEIARKIRRKIWRWVGIPVSIGLGMTKTQAKLASDYAKKQPDGVYFVDKQWIVSQSPSSSVGTIWGVGSRLVKRYRVYGINSLQDILYAPSAMLQKVGGVVALRQQAELSNVSVYGVGEMSGPQKSVMSSETFGKSSSNLDVIKSAIAVHVESVSQTLQHKKLETDMFQLYLRPKNRQITLPRWWPVYIPETTAGNARILAAILSALEDAFIKGNEYDKVGVLAMNTFPQQTVRQQMSLFSSDQPSQIVTVIDDVLQVIQKKHGSKILRVGRFSSNSTWKARHNQQSPKFFTDWNHLPTVMSSVVKENVETSRNGH